ncbi:MAG: exodeoxyribonuclease V subunit beta [Spirochaetes bacterium]|nr:exodeoxyribonuclease V subunit beta [Spirochaetota bacterium]
MKEFDFNEIKLEGTSLIEAGAGTGKTYSITNIYIRLLLEKSYDSSEIAVVTFTVAAADELRERISNKLRELLTSLESGADKIPDEFSKLMDESNIGESKIKIELALRSLDDAPIFTIHKFINKITKENAFESHSSFDAEISEDKTEILSSIIMDFIRSKINSYNKYIQKMINWSDYFKELLSFIKSVSDKPFLQDEIQSYDISESNIFAGLDELTKSAEVFTNYFSGNEDNQKIFKSFAYRTSKVNFDEMLKLTDDIISDKYIIFEKSKKFEKLFGWADTDTYHNRFSQYSAVNNDLLNAQKAISDLLDAENAAAIVKKCFKSALAIEALKYYHEAVDKIKKQKQIVFYDDIINSVYSIVKENQESELKKNISRKYSIALIDEFQDTDESQCMIFGNLFKNLIYIGDPKQSIYRFRGADIYSYIEVSKKSSNRYNLQKNWRSEENLLSAVNAFFGYKNPFNNDDIDFVPAEPCNKIDKMTVCDSNSVMNIRFQSYSNLSQLNVYEDITREIVSLLHLSSEGKALIPENESNRPLRASDIAILVYKNNEAEEIRKYLSKMGIPSAIRSGKSVFSSYEFAEFIQLISAMENPESMKKIKTALSVRFMGFTPAMIELLSDDDMSLHAERFALYGKTASSKGLLEAYRMLLKDYSAVINISVSPDAQRIITNMDHIAELLDERKRKKDYSLSELAAEVSVSLEESSEKYELRIERDDDAVQIMTVHKSKGLEFPVVFIASEFKRKMREKELGFICRIGGKNSLVMNDGSEYYNKIISSEYKDEILSENLRLFYVALTRAKFRVYLYHADKIERGNFVKNHFSALNYILNSFDASFSERSTNDVLEDFSKKYGFLFKDIGKQTESQLEPIMHTDTDKKLSARKYNERAFEIFKVASYSMIAEGKDLPYEHINSENTNDEIHSGEQVFLHEFPKGSEAGNCLHGVLEKLITDDDPDVKIIDSFFRMYGINYSYRKDVLRLLDEVKTAVFNTGNLKFSLSDIKKENMISELDFHFSFDKFVSDKFESIICEDAPYLHIPDSISEISITGFMKGFADMVFFHDGKYYILDWKSNYLGDYDSDYSEEKLIKSMRTSKYAVQLYIYTYALYKLLKIREKEFNYDKFGGFFYVYLRGVSAGSSNGIYFHRPSLDAVMKIEKEFNCD